MPSPESSRPAQLLDQQLDWPEAPVTSPQMQAVVTQLATAYDVDFSQKGANLQLDVPDQKQHWLIGNIDGHRIGVTRCQVDAENGLAPDLDLVFEITPEGWEPVELIHAERPWDEFAQAAQAQALLVFDPQGNLRYDVFTEFWAQQIAQAGGTRLMP
jgi:hypothetical protein